MDVLEAQEQSAPGSIEPLEVESILQPPRGSADAEDTSPMIAPVPDWDAPDESIAAEPDSPPDSLLDDPIPREQQPGILRVSCSRLPPRLNMSKACIGWQLRLCFRHHQQSQAFPQSGAALLALHNYRDTISAVSARSGQAWQ